MTETLAVVPNVEAQKKIAKREMIVGGAVALVATAIVVAFRERNRFSKTEDVEAVNVTTLPTE